MATTALAVPHAPVQIMVASSDPDEPDFVDACDVCWTDWPCLIAELCRLPYTDPEIANLSVYDGPYDTEPPF